MEHITIMKVTVIFSSTICTQVSFNIKYVWAFTPGGALTWWWALITASCSSKKLKIRRYYRDAVRASPDKWRKPSLKGGHTEADRQRIYSKWVSRARKKLLSINFGDIWKRHEEVGFIAKCDGSEEMLRDGNRSVLFSVKVYFGIKFM